MKKLLFLINILIVSVSIGQETDRLEVCLHNKNNEELNILNKKANTALEEITEVIGASKNFNLIPCSNIKNALAVTYNGERFILYDSEWIRNINNQVNDWSRKFILAHEVGHHINGHTKEILISTILEKQTKKRQREEELEADEFAGFVIAKLGAKFTQIIELIDLISEDNFNSHSTHPDKLKRLEAVKKGFYKAKNEGINPLKNSKNKSKKNQSRTFEINPDEKSKWDFLIPYDTNLYVFNKTGRILSEWIIYLFFIAFVTIFSYNKFKRKFKIKKLIAFEILFIFSIIIIGFCFKYMAHIYNGDELNRFSIVNFTSEKFVSQVIEPFNKNFEPNVEELFDPYWPMSFGLYMKSDGEIIFDEKKSKIENNLIYFKSAINKWNILKKISYELYPENYKGIETFEDRDMMRLIKYRGVVPDNIKWVMMKPNNIANGNYKFRFVKIGEGEEVLMLNKKSISNYLKKYIYNLDNSLNNVVKSNLISLRLKNLSSEKGIKKYWQKYKIEFKDLYIWGEPFLKSSTIFLNITILGICVRVFCFLILFSYRELK